MKKHYDGFVIASVLMLLVAGYYVIQTPYDVIESPTRENYLPSPSYPSTTNPLDWINSFAPPRVRNPEKGPEVISPEDTVYLFAYRNLSSEEQESLQTWNQLKHLVSHEQVLSSAAVAIKEACIAWKSLMTSVEEERLQRNGSSNRRGKEKPCPHFVRKMYAAKLDKNGLKLSLPCGLTQGSSITIIGIPSGLLGNFRVDLTGQPLPTEPEPPIIFHYNVKPYGDKIAEEPVIVQNTWTVANDWGEEERCPFLDAEENKKVDDLEQCNEMVGKEVQEFSTHSRHSNGPTKFALVHDGSKTKKYFPFKQGYLCVATLRVGSEGVQTTVDGKHVTSFAFRENLEPWLVSDVRISGDMKLISVVASGLPTSEDVEHITDLEALKSPPLLPKRQLSLFIGVVSTANNFKRRMAVRRTWMQYAVVRSGLAVVRFFVGLHKNQVVNEELWDEARTYGDVQLMPFVDHYSLITWKTLAICIFGVVSAKFVMKTDDDSFVRVDEVLASLSRINVSHGLLYGLITSDSQPDRNPDSKWYISGEEWPESTYPPWAHGPGYVVSSDIAKGIFKLYTKRSLKMFKLEDVAMGIWIAAMKKKGLQVTYENDERVINNGCNDSYVVAHYQGPGEMFCLWQKLQETNLPTCCHNDD